MKRYAVVVYADHSYGVSETHLNAFHNRPFREVRVRRPQSPVIDGDGSIPHDHTAERDVPVAGCTNHGPGGSGDVDPPVPAVSAGREEFANNGAGHRPGQADA